MTRYLPTYSVSLNSVDVSNDLVRIANLKGVVTNEVPSFELELDNRKGKYKGAFDYNQVAIIGIDEVTLLHGRIDEVRPKEDKDKGTMLVVKGRGDAAALMDIYVNVDIAGTPYNIVDWLINTYYGAQKGAGDPAISCDASSNGAPNSGNVTFQWRRKSIWECLLDVSNALGAPLGAGGYGSYYDFWVDPSQKFWFKAIGSIPSGISLPATEPDVKEFEYPRDALPVKNDIWLVCHPQAGRIPLGMQLDYGLPATRLFDGWTEWNGLDYTPIQTNQALPTITSDETHVKVGERSIKINAFDFSFGWAIDFPFSTLWPMDYLDCYNEIYNKDGTIQMSETMGRIVRMGFWIYPMIPGYLTIKVRDTDGHIMKQQHHVPYRDQFVHVEIPFGPDSTGWEWEGEPPATGFNWSRVNRILWMWEYKYFYPFDMSIWMDGLYFVKPLIVNSSDYLGKSRRMEIISQPNIEYYPMAKALCNGIRDLKKTPQSYYTISVAGRNDIDAGETFMLTKAEFHDGSKDLVAREITHNFDKEEGWRIQIVGYEQTSMWKPITPPRIGWLLSELEKKIAHTSFQPGMLSTGITVGPVVGGETAPQWGGTYKDLVIIEPQLEHTEDANIHDTALILKGYPGQTLPRIFSLYDDGISPYRQAWYNDSLHYITLRRMWLINEDNQEFLIALSKADRPTGDEGIEWDPQDVANNLLTVLCVRTDKITGPASDSWFQLANKTRLKLYAGELTDLRGYWGPDNSTDYSFWVAGGQKVEIKGSFRARKAIQAGNGVSGAEGAINVTFDEPFDSVPEVTVTPYYDGLDMIIANITGRTTTGFTGILKSIGNTGVTTGITDEAGDHSHTTTTAGVHDHNLTDAPTHSHTIASDTIETHPGETGYAGNHGHVVYTAGDHSHGTNTTGAHTHTYTDVPIHKHWGEAVEGISFGWIAVTVGPALDPQPS